MRSKAAVVLFSLLFLLATGCDRNAQPPARGHAKRRPNIVFILIDTLRADGLGAYGNNNGNSPTIDGIAAEGVTFEHVVAPAPWTQPSVASLFCGCYPGVHKVLDYSLAFNATYGRGAKVAVFDSTFETLAERLREGGYMTAAFVANPFLLPEYGFAQGFDVYDATFAGNLTPGNVINEAAVAWLQQWTRTKPFFLYLHYMDVHGPYDARPQMLDPLLDAVERMPNKRRLSPPELKRLGYLRKLPRKVIDPRRHAHLAQYREYWVARYQAGIREVDLHLAALEARLQEMGLWNDAYVIVTADHGEALAEHGLWDHGLSLHETDLRIPLILRRPGALPAGHRVASRVRLIDLMPTLLDQLSLPAVKTMQGRSLAPIISNDSAETPVPTLAEGVKKGPKQRALYLGAQKLIVTLAGDRAQLYDLRADPTEEQNLATSRPGDVKVLREILDREVAANQKLSAGFVTGRATITEDQYERLRALGYAP